jgi:uncharacterized membrane protein YcaP (DUF421 family)
MQELWTLSAPGWQFVVRALLMYAALLLLLRLSGKRTIGEFTPFDFMVLILIGEASQNGLIGDDHSVTAALILAVTLIGANYVVGWVTARSPRIEAVLEGTPVVLANRGQLYEGTLRRHNISRREFDMALRRARCRLEDVRLAVLEVDGDIAILQSDDPVVLAPERGSAHEDDRGPA